MALHLKVYDMNRIAAVLRRNRFTEVRAIPYAGVPICKFKATLHGETIEVDINTNERLGAHSLSLPKGAFGRKLTRCCSKQASSTRGFSTRTATCTPPYALSASL